MRLADFILENVEPIITEWEAFARNLASGTTMTKLALRDHVKGILLTTVRSMKTSQSSAQQAKTSPGYSGASSEESEQLSHASKRHGLDRLGSGFDIVEVVAEYRALRASVLHLWHQNRFQQTLDDFDDINHFNESIDQSLSVAVGSYTHHVDQSRRLFLAILGHDLRDPLNRIYVAAQLASRSANEDPNSAKALALIKTDTQTVTQLVSDLIDFASTGPSSAMPLTRKRVDLAKLCHQVFEKFCFAHPQRTLRFHADGDFTGDFDGARLQQVVSNLMGNALQHGSPEGPIDLSLASEGSILVLSIRNEGLPIPAEMLAMIFDPLMRHAMPESAGQKAAGSIGLGLYIVRAIVIAHEGTVEVTSTAAAGTVFTVRLPRTAPD